MEFGEFSNIYLHIALILFISILLNSALEIASTPQSLELWFASKIIALQKKATVIWKENLQLLKIAIPQS